MKATQGQTWRARSQQFDEFVDGQACLPYYRTQCASVKLFVIRYNHLSERVITS